MLHNLLTDRPIYPDNTIHQALSNIEPRSPLPWLHIAQVVANPRFHALAGTGGAAPSNTGCSVVILTLSLPHPHILTPAPSPQSLTPHAYSY
ncbi:hypothetical protein [Scytonema millei]|uniref:hypothetical protein n=1 Tax=Scytonema millei TaxID=1245922 RepID=UPI001914680A|nr:hypothetical protein [Scytonema millei]